MESGRPAQRDDSFRDELVEKASTLPLGELAALTRVAELCRLSTATPGEVALEASRDEGFAALLLRLANSAASGSATRIAGLPQAITRLGLRRVQALAIAAPGLRLLDGPADGLGWARSELHRHAIRVGLGARMLAPLGVDPDGALAAGILHNLGLNVLSLYAPDEFRHLLGAGDRGEQFWEEEEEILGFSHAELGALLAERWSYPNDLVVAIRDHDSPEPETALAATVQLADLLVRAHGVGIEPPRRFPPSLPLEGAELSRAYDQLGQVIQAQDRFDARIQAEGGREPVAPRAGS